MDHALDSFGWRVDASQVADWFETMPFGRFGHDITLADFETNLVTLDTYTFYQLETAYVLSVYDRLDEAAYYDEVADDSTNDNSNQDCEDGDCFIMDDDEVFDGEEEFVEDLADDGYVWGGDYDYDMDATPDDNEMEAKFHALWTDHSLETYGWDIWRSELPEWFEDMAPVFDYEFTLEDFDEQLCDCRGYYSYYDMLAAYKGCVNAKLEATM